MIRTAMAGAAALLLGATGAQACPGAVKAAVHTTISTATTATDFSSQSKSKKKAAKKRAKPAAASGGGTSVGGGAPARNTMEKPSSY